MDNMVKIEQFDELKEAVKEARQDDTPYIGIADDEIHVQGNPNNTEIKPADYVVYFAFPNTDEYNARARAKGDKFLKNSEDGRYAIYQREFNNIYLSPRRISSVVSALAQLESFLFKITDNGEVKDLTYEEVQSLVYTLSGELSDATYEVVATVLRIPYDEMEFMLPMNTIENTVKIMKNNPSAVNEADLFFDLPSEAKVKLNQ